MLRSVSHVTGTSYGLWINLRYARAREARAVSPHVCRSMFPCRMPPYSHADLPFKFPHRNSGGPANA